MPRNKKCPDCRGSGVERDTGEDCYTCEGTGIWLEYEERFYKDNDYDY